MSGIFRCTVAIAAAVTFTLMWSILPVHGKDPGPTTEPSAGKGSVSGTVTQNGQPVANAAVRLIQAAPAQGPQTQAAGSTKLGKGAKAGKHHGKPQVVSNTSTDDKGQFTLSDIEPGEYAVAAGVKGQAVGRARVRVEAGKNTNITIELKQRRGAGRAARTLAPKPSP